MNMFDLWLNRRFAGGKFEKDYIEFVDPVVAQICADTWGDGIGITYAQAAAVTSIGNVFEGKSIVSFDEFQYFTSVTELANSEFKNCSSLVSVTLPLSCVTIRSYAFRYCAALARLCYVGDTVVDGEYHLSHLQAIGDTVFQGCTPLTQVSSFGYITTTPYQPFYNDSNLATIVLPSTVTAVSAQLIQNCSAIRTLVCYATTPPTVAANAFRTGGSQRVVTVYVPYSADHSVLAAYESASGWAIPGAGNGLKEFKELDQNGNIPT